MAGPLNHERRASRRGPPAEHAGTDRARLRPGRAALVLNLSPGGALIETEYRLAPGARVELQIGEARQLFEVFGHVLRCHVTSLTRERVWYRGAIAFEKLLPIGEVTTPKRGV